MRILSVLVTALVAASLGAQAIPPQVTPFGVGCPGYGGRAPTLEAVGVPSMCNAGFGLRVSRGRPDAPGLFLLGSVEAVVSFGPGCEYYPLGAFGLAFVLTDGAGAAQIALPIGTDPALHGFRFVTQAFVFDPQGNIAGHSGSNGLRITIGMVLPLAPSLLRPDNVWSRRLDLRWNDNSCNESGFVIEQSASGGPFSVVGQPAANDVSFRVQNLVPNTQYCFRVRAQNAAGDSAYSNTLCVTTTNEIPAPPTGLRLLNLQPRQATLGWTDNSDNETEFRIALSRNGVDFNNVGTTAANQTTFTILTLTPDTNYWVKVRAGNAVGYSEYTATLHFKTPNEPPAAPSNLRTDNIWSTRVDLRWDDNSDNETEFRIAISRNGVDYNGKGVVPANQQTFRAEDLQPNTLYWFKVRAANAAGFSDYSAPIPVVTRR